MQRMYLSFLPLVLLLIGCAPSDRVSESSPEVVEVSTSPATRDDFGDYWYQGEAELTSYRLEQARYGEMRHGEAVLIFVTEDFSRKKHVKLDNSADAGDDKVSVLKLNMTKNFVTGIYPYSMMSSVFTPVQGSGFPRTLKTTTSSQEWCGHTFTQVNLKKGKYHFEMRSYFESEGDQQVELEGVMLEDEIWTIIRLDPDRLPTGALRLIPGTMYQRLSHQPWRVQAARATLEEVDGLARYTVEYEDLDRTLSILFNPEFPHEIEGWEDTYSSGRGGRLTTRARRNRRMMLDYWNHNGNEDEILREELGLD